MNLFDLESFVAVVDSGSVMAAAARLHLTQSAVTRRVQSLEDALGVSLLDRQMRPLQPTRAGQMTYDLAKPILANVINLKATVVHNDEPSGEFCFGVVRGLGDLAILDPVKALRTQFPHLHLHAYVQGTKTLLERLHNKTIDAAALLFSQGTEPPTNLITEYLGKQSGIVVASHTLTYPGELTLQDISTESWIVNAEDCGTRRSLEDAFSRRNLDLRIAIEADGKDFQLSMASRGLGLAVIPPQVYQTSPYRDQLQVLHISDFSPAQDVWIAHSKYAGHQEKAVECLRNAVLQYLRRMEEAAQVFEEHSAFANAEEEISDGIGSSPLVEAGCGA